MEILGFFAMVLGTLMDPIRTPGYIISGWLIKNLAGALTASILWNLLLYAVIIAPQAAREHSSPRVDVLFASCVGAALMTGMVYFFASRRRKRQHAELAAKEDKSDQEPLA